MIDVTLTKEKYRNPNRRLLKRSGIDPIEGTWTFNGGKYKAKTSNAGSKTKGVTAGNGPRKRAYGPW